MRLNQFSKKDTVLQVGLKPDRSIRFSFHRISSPVFRFIFLSGLSVQSHSKRMSLQPGLQVSFIFQKAVYFLNLAKAFLVKSDSTKLPEIAARSYNKLDQ